MNKVVFGIGSLGNLNWVVDIIQKYHLFDNVWLGLMTSFLAFGVVILGGLAALQVRDWTKNIINRIWT